MVGWNRFGDEIYFVIARPNASPFQVPVWMTEPGAAEMTVRESPRVDLAALRNPFYMLAPEVLQFPLVILATMAAVIASQAVISGAFSVTQQAIQLGFVPRLRIEHTSASTAGQIYIQIGRAHV